MSLISNNIRLPVLMLLALTLTSGCGYRIEWDEHDPKLHGQVVHFKVPMRYVLLEERHVGGYKKEFVEIGRILRSERAVFMPGGDAKQGYLSERIPDGMSFTVTGSFWRRLGWFIRGIDEELRLLLLVDENGVESFTSFGTLTSSSDRPELGELKNEGRYK